MTTVETSRTTTHLVETDLPARHIALVPSTAAESPPTTPNSTTAGHWMTLAVIGVVGGVLSGLFAIGGAILMVPLLVWRAGMDQRRAAATSLVAIIPTGLVSSTTYLIHGDVNVVTAVWVSLGAIAGAAIGSRLLSRLPLTWLRWMFIAFIVVVAIRMFVEAPDRGHMMASTPWLAVGQVALGLFTGIASGLFGIGGAIIAVPLLVSVFGVGDLVAKGTALLVGVPTSVVGTLSNRRTVRVDIRAGLVLGFAAAVAAVPAALLAVAIPARVSGIMFGVLLLAIATQLTFQAIRTARTPHSDTAPVPVRPESLNGGTS
ncbi:MAG: sulfite exporter TauE/SafE family protein [Actinomycetota bacterium]|nr:sulfite exporter TauE/SafE family protein [Actinomycetota bacterium]